MRTKKENLKEHKKLPKRHYTADIVSGEDSKKLVEYQAKMVEDTSGFYRKLELIASDLEDSPWNREIRGKTIIKVEDYDMDVVLTLAERKDRKQVKINISYGDLCDIVTAFDFMETVYAKRTGIKGKTPVKIKNLKAKEVKEIK